MRMTVETGPPDAGLRRLHVAGVDVLITADGRPYLLEINDRPLMLSRVSVQPGATRSPTAVSLLGDSLLAAADTGEIGVVLPEAFAVRDADPGGVLLGEPARWRADAADFVDDNRVAAALADLSAFCNAVTERGGSVRVLDARAPTPRRLGPVWNKSQADMAGHPLTVNDRQAAMLCIDKLATRRVCTVDGSIPAIPASREKTAQPPATQDGPSTMHILKPRTGSASRAVHRGPWPAIHEALQGIDEAEDFMVEPWLDSARLAVGDKRYRFDIRVFVIAGTGVGFLARKAAAPADGPFDDSPLSWLTTTGSVLPVRPARQESATACDGEAFLPGPWLDSAAQLAERAVAAVEAASAPGGQPPLPPLSFRELHRLTGRLRPITVQAEPVL